MLSEGSFALPYTYKADHVPQFHREPTRKEVVKKINVHTNSHAALNAISSPPWRPHPSGKRHQCQSASTTPDSSLRNAAQSRLLSQKRTQTTPDSLRSTSDLLSPPSPSAPPPPSTPPWSTTSLGCVSIRSSSPQTTTPPVTAMRHHTSERSSPLLA